MAASGGDLRGPARRWLPQHIGEVRAAARLPATGPPGGAHQWPTAGQWPATRRRPAARW